MAKYPIGELLKKIDSPHDLRRLSANLLPQLSDEVRRYMIDVLSEIGNPHFAASLGVVELTVALHYVFDTNRLKGGISGFPKYLLNLQVAPFENDASSSSYLFSNSIKRRNDRI